MKNHPPQDLAAWLHDQLTRRGYDLGPRGGGRSRFAETSGISPSSVGRLLRGDPVTDIRVLELLARALGTPLGEILIRAGVLRPEDLPATDRAPTPTPLTIDQAADDLGIDDPADRKVFEATVEALQDAAATRRRQQQQ